LPREAKIIGLENSSAKAGAVIGAGPVVRVGDRRSIFDPRVTEFLIGVCRGLEADGKNGTDFQFQRKLMDGGSCETTVFCAAGYEAGAVCLPLGNYHNIGYRGKAGAEYVSLADLQGLIDLLVECVRRRGEYDEIVDAQASAFRSEYDSVLEDLRDSWA
jgi:putative aminopeptidase FrvX